ncbi:MAG: aminopeptidase P family protein [Saprospiraceae bacterium]|nr:aminopeptidase P family protein [Saprospiraceae bacterium]
MHFKTFDSHTYIQRRQVLKSTFGSGLILLMGNHESPINFRDNTYRFRQDSTFLYYFGLDVAGLAAIIDIDSGSERIFGTDLTIDDIVWTGPLPTLSEMAHTIGVYKTSAYGKIEIILSSAIASNRPIHFLPPYRYDNMIRLSEWLHIPINKLADHSSISLIKSIVRQRAIKEACEIDEIHRAANITANMHEAAMNFALPGMKEYELVSVVHQEALKGGGDLSFATILTVNGETLHNHFHGNTIKEGQMILCDAGAETNMHYAGDMTCTFPVGRTFTQKQKDIYEIVLNTHEAAVGNLKPGITYKEIYLKACENIFSGLKDIGITKGNPAEAVHEGAHAMFFQCGLGHMLGLDVHDMEDLGEQYVGYSDKMVKSTQFGMKSLRLGRTLETGFVLTVEPGIYFIPTLIDMWRSEGKFKDFIDYEKLDQYRDFSGIRVEEDFVITKTGSALLGRSLPKTISEIEEVRSKVFM